MIIDHIHSEDERQYCKEVEQISASHKSSEKLFNVNILNDLPLTDVCLFNCRSPVRPSTQRLI